MTETKQLFEIGTLVSTPGVTDVVSMEDILASLSRHVSGDWGECDPHDAEANEEALAERLRIFSVYRSRAGTKFWIITEADRSSTCVLLPSEY